MSTIEKALQKQQAMAKEQARNNATGAETDNAEQQQSSIEKAFSATENLTQSQAQQHTKAQPQPETSSRSQNTVRSPAENKRKTPLLDLTKLKQGFVSNKGRQLINEEFRAIKRKVLNNAFGALSKTLNNSNIIMVTSPRPSEGKTFTAINLALSIALEQNKTVLLVDADVLRPNVMKTLDQSFDNGLMEYLLGEVNDLSEVIHHTSLDTLRIIPAGKSHHLSTELLASEKMLETVEEFASRYPDRVVIFDTPPLIGINETAILANLAGQAVVVVQEGKSNLTSVASAVEQLNPDMAKGFVINRASRSTGEDYRLLWLLLLWRRPQRRTQKIIVNTGIELAYQESCLTAVRFSLVSQNTG